jgi:hypothetical protein
MDGHDIHSNLQHNKAKPQLWQLVTHFQQVKPAVQVGFVVDKVTLEQDLP